MSLHIGSIGQYVTFKKLAMYTVIGFIACSLAVLMIHQWNMTLRTPYPVPSISTHMTLVTICLVQYKNTKSVFITIK